MRLNETRRDAWPPRPRRLPRTPDLVLTFLSHHSSLVCGGEGGGVGIESADDKIVFVAFVFTEA